MGGSLMETSMEKATLGVLEQEGGRIGGSNMNKSLLYAEERQTGVKKSRGFWYH